MAPMMAPMLRLYEDVLANDAEISLPARPRMIYVVHGAITMGDLSLRDDEAFGSEKAVTCKAERAGATLWRWELAADGEASAASGPGVVSREKLSAAARHHAQRGGAVARRQRRFSARRLRLSAPPSGARHPLPAPRRHPHRHQGPFDVVWAGRRLV